MGGRQFLGWGQDRQIAAATYDAVRDNTLATGNFKKGKKPSFKPWPRPKGKPRSKPKATVKDLFKRMRLVPGQHK